MTDVGQKHGGVWPEKPTHAEVGDTVLYSQPDGTIARGKIVAKGYETVLFDNQEWCYVWQMSEDS